MYKKKVLYLGAMLVFSVFFLSLAASSAKAEDTAVKTLRSQEQEKTESAVSAINPEEESLRVAIKAAKQADDEEKVKELTDKLTDLHRENVQKKKEAVKAFEEEVGNSVEEESSGTSVSGDAASGKALVSAPVKEKPKKTPPARQDTTKELREELSGERGDQGEAAQNTASTE